MICDLCKEEINIRKERYVHIEDWNKEKMIKEIWVHLKCFKKGMNRELTLAEKQGMEIIKKAGRIFESDSFNEIFPKKEEEYVIT